LNKKIIPGARVKLEPLFLRYLSDWGAGNAVKGGISFCGAVPAGLHIPLPKIFR
jgi:hypothetical protein